MSATRNSSFSISQQGQGQGQGQGGARNRKFSFQMGPTSTYLGRSYVGSFISPPFEGSNEMDESKLPISGDSPANSRMIHETGNLHKQTAMLSNTFDAESDGVNELSVLSPEEQEELDRQALDIDKTLDGQNRGDMLQDSRPIVSGDVDDDINFSSSYMQDDTSLLEMSDTGENLALLPSNSHNSFYLEYGTYDEESQSQGMGGH